MGGTGGKTDAGGTGVEAADDGVARQHSFHTQPLTSREALTREPPSCDPVAMVPWALTREPPSRDPVGMVSSSLMMTGATGRTGADTISISGTESISILGRKA